MIDKRPTDAAGQPLVSLSEQRKYFEALLFNLVTSHGAVPGYFSSRLRVTTAMLAAYDTEVARLTAERQDRTQGAL